MELFVEDFEALFGDFVGDQVVDTDLHVVQASFVKSFNPFNIEEIAVGDHAGDGARLAHAADDVVQMGMGEGLAAGDADHGGAEAAKVVDAAKHFVEGDGLGNLVVLIAVAAA